MGRTKRKRKERGKKRRKKKEGIKDKKLVREGHGGGDCCPSLPG